MWLSNAPRRIECDWPMLWETVIGQCSLMKRMWLASDLRWRECDRPVLYDEENVIGQWSKMKRMWSASDLRWRESDRPVLYDEENVIGQWSKMKRMWSASALRECDWPFLWGSVWLAWRRERGNAPALPAPNDFLQLETKNVLWALYQLGPREGFKPPTQKLRQKSKIQSISYPWQKKQSLCDSWGIPSNADFEADVVKSRPLSQL